MFTSVYMISLDEGLETFLYYAKCAKSQLIPFSLLRSSAIATIMTAACQSYEHRFEPGAAGYNPI
jgi:hypothetical protein